MFPLAIEKVRAYFARLGYEAHIQEFSQSSATVELAAQAVGVIPARIAKTLSFKRGDGCILVVTAGDARIDNKKFKAEFGIKASMPAPGDVLALTGHAVGGVCPFGVENPNVETFLDCSMKRFNTIFPAAGSDNSAVELTCDELERFSNAVKWVDVCKDWAD